MLRASWYELMHMHTYSSYIVMNQQTCMNNQPCGGVISESSKSSPPPCTPLSTSSARMPPLHSFQANSGQLHLHPKSVARRRRRTPPTIRRAPAPSLVPPVALSQPARCRSLPRAPPPRRRPARPPARTRPSVRPRSLAVRTSSALRIGGASSRSAEQAGDISRHACVSFHK